MRASSAMRLLSVCCGGFLMTILNATAQSTSGAYGERGCAADVRGARIMTGPYFADGTAMSAEICYAECQTELPGFKFFGTQFSKQCWCAESLAPAVTFDYDKCTKPCLGDMNVPPEICGGNDALTVYELGFTGPTPEPTPEATPEPTSPQPYTKLDCFVDTNGAKIMDKILFGVGPNEPMSAEICYKGCLAQDSSYTHFGLEFKWQCWCATGFDPAAQTSAAGECELPCVGNPDEDCGGNQRLLAYKIKDV